LRPSRGRRTHLENSGRSCRGKRSVPTRGNRSRYFVPGRQAREGRLTCGSAGHEVTGAKGVLLFWMGCGICEAKYTCSMHRATLAFSVLIVLVLVIVVMSCADGPTKEGLGHGGGGHGGGGHGGGGHGGGGRGGGRGGRHWGGRGRWGWGGGGGAWTGGPWYDGYWYPYDGCDAWCNLCASTGGARACSNCQDCV